MQISDEPDGAAPAASVLGAVAIGRNEGARLLASGRQGRKLAVRHAQHQKALVQ